MSLNIPKWFSEEFQSDVHMSYQQRGSKLRHTVRTQHNVKGQKTYFNTAGQTRVTFKARGADVPIVSGQRARVACELFPQFGGDYVEDLDQIMTSLDEKKVLAQSFAWAHGRQTDQLIIEQLRSSDIKQIVTSKSSQLSQDNIQEAIQKLNDNDVPDDGMRTALVSPKAWEQLLKIDAFAHASYVGEKDLPWVGGAEAKKWRNCLWMIHNQIKSPSSNTKTYGFIYHKSAIGHAIGKELTTSWSWENSKSCWFINTRMLQGATLIDPKGVVKFEI